MDPQENISIAADSTDNQGAPTQEAVLWRTRDVAHYLQVDSKTVFNLRKRGLPYLQIGGAVRFVPEEIKAYLVKNRGLAAHRLRQTIRRGDR